ncbi:Protein of unknown function [Gryllus bimaculatus]|nr:Protein of unknown function [Gryllus bimaculatus]
MKITTVKEETKNREATVQSLFLLVCVPTLRVCTLPVAADFERFVYDAERESGACEQCKQNVKLFRLDSRD